MQRRNRIPCAVVVVCALGGTAWPGTVNVDNGVSGAGHVDVSVDDYGCFGFALGGGKSDSFQPAGATNQDTASMAGAMLFVTTPGDGKRTAVVLNDGKWGGYQEPMGDGIQGDHALTRVITMANASVATNRSQSAFVIGEAIPGVKLSIALDQQLVYDATNGTTTFDQTYAITNDGAVAVDAVLFAYWDADLWWDSDYFSDIAGVGAGRCYVYMRDSTGEPDRAISLTDGGSTVPLTHYFGSKLGVTPALGPPAYGGNYLSNEVFTNFGIPVSWRNHVANVGYDTAGESGPSPGTNSAIGTEYQVPLAVGASETIVVRRIYGTYMLPCPTTSTSCGNGVVETGEDCDTGADDPTCNAATCTPARCGDGYVNVAAGEACESGGVDTESCNATCTAAACGDGYANAAAGEACDSAGVDAQDCNADCTLPACGDGHVNAAAGEACDQDRLCDPVTCTFTFSVGGGCAGCSASGWPSATLPSVVVLLGLWRRRRRRT